MTRLTLLAVSLFAVVGLGVSDRAAAHSMCNCNLMCPGPTGPNANLPTQTSLQFTVDLAGLDVGLSTTGSAQLVGGNTVILPVTGGSFATTPISGTIEHNGSGIEFEFDVATITLEDLEFDFDDGLVRADLSSGVFNLSTGVFDLVPCIGGGCTGATDPDSQFGLFLRPQAADFFENVVFGDEGFDDGDQIALATLAAEPVSEPGVLMSVAVGLAAIAGARRRRALN